MRITIFAAGSRGDVQPAAVLGAELVSRGHHVTLAAPSDLLHLGRDLGVRTVSMGFAAKEFLLSDEGRGWLAAGKSRKYIAGVLDHKLKLARTLQDALLDASEGADLIVSGVLMQDEAACIAEADEIPVVSVHFAPRRENSSFPPPIMSAARFPALITRLLHAIFARVEWNKTKPYINDFRERLRLAPTSLPVAKRMARTNATEIQAFSGYLVPELVQYRVDRPLVGYISPTSDQHKSLGDLQSDPLLDEWIDSDAAPVYFGFGSMPVADAPAMLALIARVCERLGVRALVGTGWSDYETPVAEGDTVRLVGPIDHSAYLPRCRVAVHHGGAGTTAAVVAAGIPSVVCAVTFDQPFWGRRLEDRGVGKLLRMSHLTEDSLVSAISSMLREEPRRRAVTLGAAVRSEHGLVVAADIIENRLLRASRGTTAAWSARYL